MKLRTPKTITLEHRTELPEYLSYLADDGVAWLSATVKPGGHLNPGYLDAQEKIDLKRRVVAQALVGKSGEEYAKAKDASDRKIGEAIIASILEHLVEGWSTNIIDDETGKPLETTAENFMWLSELRIPEVAEWVKGIARTATDLAKFIRNEDEETEKN